MTTEQGTTEATVEKISVARAMTWLKHFDANIGDTIARLGCGEVFKNGKSVTTGTPKEEVLAKVQANRDSIDDLLKTALDRRVKIAKSNMDVVIKVGDREMTIAEALIFKAQILPHLEAWAKHVAGQNRALKAKFATEFTKWETQIVGATPEAVEAMRASSEPELVDSSDYLEKQIKIIEDFKRELDAALNESNALTMLIL